jgi:hypothetical protein
VLLDGLPLLDEAVLGAGEAALDDVAHDGSAELGAEAGSLAEHLAGGEHFDWEWRGFADDGEVFQSLVNVESEVVWWFDDVGARSGHFPGSLGQLLIGWTAEVPSAESGDPQPRTRLT